MTIQERMQVINQLKADIADYEKKINQYMYTNVIESNKYCVLKKQAENNLNIANLQLQKLMNNDNPQTIDITQNELLFNIADTNRQIAENTKQSPVQQRQDPIKETLQILINAGKVIYMPELKKTINNKEIKVPAEYRIKTSLNDIYSFLESYKDLPITDIKQFMITYLKGKKGGRIADSFKTMKHKSKQVKNRK